MRAIFGLSLSLAFHSTAQKDIKKTRQLTAHLATAFSLMDVIVKERGSGIGNPEQRGAPRQNPLLYICPHEGRKCPSVSGREGW